MASKAKSRRDEVREERIIMEIVVDAYDEHERALGWYCYLQDRMQFPFRALCIAKRAISPLRVKDKVEVVGMPDEVECEREIFVTIPWDDANLAVPLSQLKPHAGADQQTLQAVEDWHYWVEMGYQY